MGSSETNTPATATPSSGPTEKPESASTMGHGHDSPVDSEADPSKSVDQAAVEAAPPAANQPNKPPTKARIFLSITALCLAAFLGALDQTIIATILPTIANELKASEADYGWIGSSYLLALAAVVPCWGKGSDIFGRKPVLLLASFLFLIGSLLAALSTNVGMLLAGRVIAGMGAGGLLTLVNICISDMFSMRERGMYMGLISLIFGFASAIGPVLGGVFAQQVTWRWGFWINLPVGGATMIMIFIFLHLETPKTPLVKGLKAIDWLGCFTIIGAVTMFLVGLGFGGVTYPWASAAVICLIVFGVLFAILFAFIEARVAEYPILPGRILTVRSNIAALLCGFTHGLAFMSGAYYLPVYFQTVLGASPLLSGVYLLPYVVVLSLFGVLSGVYIKSTGKYRPPIIFGLALMTLGLGLLINLPSYASWPQIIIFQLIAATGAGCLLQSPIVALQAHVNPADMASVTSAFILTRQLSFAISIVMCNTILQNGLFKRVHSDNSLPPNIVNSLGNGSVGDLVALLKGDLTPSNRQTLVEYATDSIRVIWIVCTVIGFIGFVISWFVQPRELNKTHTMAKLGLEAEKANKAARLEEKRKWQQQQSLGSEAHVVSEK